jgi:NAD(P)-dependent dehydrogenase (short-subunit alcohol dehydrogenase family)
MHTIIGAERLARAKRSFTTRSIDDAALRSVCDVVGDIHAGDIVLARVASLGQHQQVELTNSRKAKLFIGDEVIVAYGNRYAPDQFEAEVPLDLGPCALAAAGGIAGRVIAQHAKMDEPTMLEPIGLFCDDACKVTNLRDHALPDRRPQRKVPGIAVVGGSMNAGKTTTAASVVRGLAQAGLKVGAAKITGTGAGNDYWHMADAGAHAILDFTDAGLATTYKASKAELERCAFTLAAGLVDRGVDIMVFEIADGLFQQETSWLVSSPALEPLVDGYVYAGESAASCAIGVQWLRQYDRLVLGLSGIVSASPLAARETLNATGLPCLTREQLMAGAHGRFWYDLLAANMVSIAA